MVNPDAPKIALDIDFESNHAFFFAIFVLLCAMAWAIRDHRRRNLEAMVAQTEDKLYIGVLTILFTICLFGSYYAFRRQVSSRLTDMTDQPVLQRRIEEAVAEKLRRADIEDAELAEDPIRILFVVTGGSCIAGVFLFILWFFTKRGQPAQGQQQAQFVPRGAMLEQPQQRIGSGMQSPFPQ